MAHILLIDDDEILRDTVLQMLELDGHRVTEAENGAAGLRLFGNGAGFDVVITDMLMPMVDGARVIVELLKRQPTLPIIAISGGRRMLSPEFNLQTASLAGATCELAKPFSRQELRAALDRTLGTHVRR